MHYYPGSRCDELNEYTSQDAWVVFLPSSKKTLLFPHSAKGVVDLIRQSKAQSLSRQELADAFNSRDAGDTVSDELLSSLVKAGILSCR